MDRTSPATDGVRSCPACGGRGGAVEDVPGKRAVGGGPLRLATCGACGTRYQPAVPTLDELARWYDYMGHHPGNTTMTPLLERRLERLLAVFEPFRRTGRLVEVGCGGGLLARVATARGWTVHGTEISPSCAALLGPLLGERLHVGELDGAPWPAGAFDVVVLSEVIEHLEAPRRYVDAAHRLLRPGGALYLTTPNARGASARVLGPRWRVVADEHLSYFHRDALVQLLRRAGFGEVRVSYAGVDLAAGGDLARRLRHLVLQRSKPATHIASTESRTSAEPAMLQRSMTVLRAALTDGAMQVANRVLDAARLGDSLKVVAVKPS